MTASKWIVVAHLVRPQGRNGELLAEILTDFPERFADRKRLYLARPNTGTVSEPNQPREMSLEGHWLHKGRIVLKFAGIDSINDAEGLRGMDVLIPREERAPLEEGAIYLDDLVGCTVVDFHGTESAGEEVGEVIDVDRESTAGALLVVRQATGEVLIPFVKAFLRHVDLNARRIEMNLPEGLLDLNRPATPEERAASKEQDR